LINAPKEAPAAERDRARAKAEEVLKKVRAAPDSFADLAKVESQDAGSAAKGGDLDFFQRGAMVKPFEDAVFAMKKGDISDVVSSDFGFHIIKLTDLKVPKQRSFDELRGNIESDLKTQQAQRKYAEVAELFTNTVYEQSDSLKPAAEKLQLKVQLASQLQRQTVPGSTGVLANEKFLAAVFATDSIEKKRNTEAVEVGVSQLAAGRVLKHNPARTLPLNEVRQIVRERVVVAKSAEMAKKDGAEKLAQFKADPSKAVLPAALMVSRDQPQGFPAQIVTAVLRANATVLPAWIGVDQGDKGYAIIRINKLVPRMVAEQASARQDRDQYAQWWTLAEAQAYYGALKERMDAQILVPVPANGSTTAPANK